MDMAARPRRHPQLLPSSVLDNGESLPPRSHSHPSSGPADEKSPSFRFWVVVLIVVGGFLFLPSILSWSFSFSSPALTRSRPQLTQAIAVDPHGRRSEEHTDVKDDSSLGGLLSEAADRFHCQSRGVIHRFRQRSKYRPSPYLVTQLRKYEKLHRKCAPGTEQFNRSFNLLDNGHSEGEAECRYVVWIAYSGLGNMLLSIASSFVYALLTNRVLLLDGQTDLGDLLCEPFPGASWLLPSDFPLLVSHSFNESSPHRFGHLLEKGIFTAREVLEKDATPTSESGGINHVPVLSYIHITHTYNFYDKLLFCEKEQGYLNHVPWLFLKSNQYFLPSLYLYIPQFREELDRLFPQREAIFHHIGRYLFYPTNSVWSWITRFYYAYLAKATERVGIQIRTFESGPAALPYISDQVLTCAIENNVLPKTTQNEEDAINETEGGERRSIAILVTSLQQEYFEEIRDTYLEYPTETGDLVSVYQPSHELAQQTEKHDHNKKAWAEICLLSFSDKLITSPMSTFGYAAQGLAGITPWMLARVENETMPSPVCSQTTSMDPCFHAPPYYNCRSGRGTDTSLVLPFVRHCEDVRWGLKLFKDDDS